MADSLLAEIQVGAEVASSVERMATFPVNVPMQAEVLLSTFLESYWRYILDKDLLFSLRWGRWRWCDKMFQVWKRGSLFARMHPGWRRQMFQLQSRGAHLQGLPD